MHRQSATVNSSFIYWVHFNPTFLQSSSECCTWSLSPWYSYNNPVRYMRLFPPIINVYEHIDKTSHTNTHILNRIVHMVISSFIWGAVLPTSRMQGMGWRRGGGLVILIFLIDSRWVCMHGWLFWKDCNLNVEVGINSSGSSLSYALIVFVQLKGTMSLFCHLLVVAEEWKYIHKVLFFFNILELFLPGKMFYLKPFKTECLVPVKKKKATQNI